MTVDGRPVRLDQEFRSPYRRNRIEAQVSAFSYRDPSLVRYRFRIRDGDPWSEPTSHTTFQFYNLTSGRYALRFAASLDGVHWTETPSAVRFAIDRPWFGQWWFLALVFIALAAAVWTVHRVRVVRLVALAEQRTRIAMDLHDAIGSGLGSIGLLAGIGARPATNAERRRDLSGQVAKMAGELGTSLSEIVWSLRPGSETLASLAQYLRERANVTFLETGARFVAEFPETWPDVRLSLTARRNLLLIVLEALHNAAAHAEATEVRLGIASRGSSWALWVQDDGVGIKHGVRPGGGMGTENMKRRAAEIGATLEWSGRAPRGTVVTLILDPSSISA
jgi:signal transduction histidine kinase